ncbi:MAG TPA: tRNA (guanosine(37)-N1)-methyltransferase TrmD [Elusimicrobiales bacterium]|nr:tRNA (guanosine(37)-N1)-methyltransferase TrmD [Elusimicrobiales bacterium]
MKIDVITIFPEMVDAPLKDSIVGRARKRKIVNLGFTNPRLFTKDKHRTLDDRPYGGGAGMVMMAEPIYKAVKKVKKKDSYVVLMSPIGKVFNQKMAKKLSKKKHLIIICGHYEGVDARIESEVDESISIGDFVLTGGEAAAIVVIDCITRMLPGVFNKKETIIYESFTENLLEAPHYTRPEVWRKKKVPEVLLSGNHKKIEKWRNEQSLKLTKKLRPDLLGRFKENKK